MSDEIYDFDEEMDNEYAEWLDYWNGLTDDERAREKAAMAAYTEECRAERERLGHDV